ncbi:hypothetical protein SAMN05877753_106196 [Bacillus oleivorans]|uniref:Uncharacterized protein n=1 Tax=Bacillus oleivorans TaxID=1448271 RepID=A0A285CYY7_9BACI|nr:CBO0543 family protein [Bacillus oleivorans]SNX72761.1 hypothetical protein SAMN05877753_106196 [Bacillus oleivorans]
MKDRSILHLITISGLVGSYLAFRKGSIKDWFLVYLFKGIISSLIDTPIAKNKLVQYPTRYFSRSYDTNIIFDYIVFPMVCVVYSRITNKMKGLSAILSVFFLSIPMTLVEEWLQRKTKLINYSRQWNWLNTLIYLTLTFWSSRVFVTSVRFFDKKRNKQSESNSSQNPNQNISG